MSVSASRHIPAPLRPVPLHPSLREGTESFLLKHFFWNVTPATPIWTMETRVASTNIHWNPARDGRSVFMEHDLASSSESISKHGLFSSSSMFSPADATVTGRSPSPVSTSTFKVRDKSTPATFSRPLGNKETRVKNQEQKKLERTMGVSGNKESLWPVALGMSFPAFGFNLPVEVPDRRQEQPKKDNTNVNQIITKNTDSSQASSKLVTSTPSPSYLSTPSSTLQDHQRQTLAYLPQNQSQPHPMTVNQIQSSDFREFLNLADSRLLLGLIPSKNALPHSSISADDAAALSLGRRFFPCPQCRYTTDRRNNLKRHTQTMHQMTSKKLECCGLFFSTKALLREHSMSFHYHGYTCHFCGRRFCRKALLKRHLSVHSGQKEFVCDVCDYATSHKSNLLRHIKIHSRHDEGKIINCSFDARQGEEAFQHRDGPFLEEDTPFYQLVQTGQELDVTAEDLSNDEFSVSSDNDDEDTDAEINVHSD